MSDFNRKYCKRSKAFAIEIIKFYESLPKLAQHQMIGKQLFRSGTSVAANFRAAARARSEKEYFSKLSIVVEECDETLFWIELLEESELMTLNQTSHLRNESEELLKIFASTRKKIGERLK